MTFLESSSRKSASALVLGVLAGFVGCGNGTVTPGGTGGTPGTGGAAGGSGGALLASGGASPGGGAPGAGGAGGAATGGGSSTGGASGSGAAAGSGGVAGVLADVTVSAGALNRDHTITTFEYPAGAGQVLILREAGGAELPVQVDASGVAMFVLPTLASGAQATFTLETPAAALANGVTATEAGGAVQLSVGTSKVAEFRTVAEGPVGVEASSVRAGYLHPVYTPLGTVVTDDYRDGDDGGGHSWHHGIWAAWTQANFDGNLIDFWNAYKNEGKIDLESLEGTWQGPVHAGLDAKIIHVDLLGGGTTAINERWIVRAYKTHEGVAPYLVFDLESTQTATATVEVLEWEYGGFAIRGRVEWRDTPADANFAASDGLTRTTGNGQAGRWSFVGGTLAGQPAGVAALGHPSNFRAPQKMRIHDTLPYMTFAPVRDGTFSIEPGTPYVTRLRFVTVDGAPDAALLDRLWDDYATPPEVTVTPR